MKEAAVTLTKAQSQEEKSKTSTGSVNFFPCFFFSSFFNHDPTCQPPSSRTCPPASCSSPGWAATSGGLVIYN